MFIEEIDKRIEAGDFDLSDLFVDLESNQKVDGVVHCALEHSSSLHSILLYSNNLIVRLSKDEWSMIVSIVSRSDILAFEKFLDFLLICCRIDDGYLKDIGVPGDYVSDLVRRKSSPDFPYFHPSESKELEPRQLKANQLKLQSFAEAGLSESQILKLYNLFSNDEILESDFKDD